jgi:uncharacterized protein (DUF924 family)
MYSDELEQVLKGNLEHWKKDHHAALAYVILCDQFSKAIHRGSSKAYSFDPFAQKMARSIIGDKTRFKKYRLFERLTILLPLMNSEYLRDVEQSLAVFEELQAEAQACFLEKVEEALFFKYKGQLIKNMDILKKFRRYPERNEVLGRKFKKAEIDYLQRQDGPLKVLCLDNEQDCLELHLLLHLLGLEYELETVSAQDMKA